jgi:glutamyl-tRNA reductase
VNADATITALVAHARSVSEARRAQLAVRLRAAAPAGIFVFETCHRVEGYAVSETGASLLIDAGEPDARLLRDAAAVSHAVTVAVGRDSVVVGEGEVLHQLRSAVDGARSAGTLDPALERMFGGALRAGRIARSWRAGPERSLATVALSAIKRLTGPVDGAEILVVGAGRMGRLVARAATAQGLRVAIANRDPAAADRLARAVGGRAVPFDPDPGSERFRGIVLAISGPWSIHPGTGAQLAASGVAVVDLSVPTAVEPHLREALGSRFVSADDLARADIERLPDEDRHADRIDALITETADAFLGWFAGRHRRAAAAALTRRVDAAREAELAALWRRVPDLDPSAREAIEAMTRHFADRVLQEPLGRLRRDADGEAERALREIFAL